MLVRLQQSAVAALCDQKFDFFGRVDVTVRFRCADEAPQDEPVPFSHVMNGRYTHIDGAIGITA